MLELLLRGLLFLGEAILGLIFGYFFYSAGWLLLRLLTLGRYPRLPLDRSRQPTRQLDRLLRRPLPGCPATGCTGSPLRLNTSRVFA